MDIDIIANDSIIVGCINAGYQGENLEREVKK